MECHALSNSIYSYFVVYDVYGFEAANEADIVERNATVEVEVERWRWEIMRI
jgi:hypothetical protein